MEFNTLVDFKEAIREWSVLNGREISFVKNESYRVRVECKAKCGFLVLCSKVGHKHTYAIKTLVDTHTCARVLNNRSANSRWVAKHVVKKMQSSENVRIRDIMQDVRQKFSVGITVARAWKAKLMAKKIVEGDADMQYAALWRYASELKRVNSGNTVKINVERPSPTIQPRFGSFYFSFDGCNKGFINGCRPFIGVDGCHLKTKYCGQLLIAVGRDPNDQYFPLAFGVVETETKESWRWFIQLLMEDIGHDKRIVFISDQQKGLVAVFDEMFERIEHRFCLRHLYANFKKKFGGGTLIRDLMMGAAKSTYHQAWMQKMNELKNVDFNAWTWLMRKVKAKVTEVVQNDDQAENEEQNNVETEFVQNDDQAAVQNDVEPENVHDEVPNDVQSQTQSCVVDTSQPQPKKKKTIKPHHGLKIRRSERIKLSWFKKPITGPGSSEQPITIEDPAETSSSLGVSTRSLKKWKKQKSS
ncbi:uncharacterized protein LOC131631465 [Vicia villosa]|uniref:uncharacterized protein LOC131631465 n=1 Tax=Vicia villosa TaxID=3911 RepID=UPI00273AE008|nr:uncharacterized protein LOC131631465 [Vicia villosa]